MANLNVRCGQRYSSWFHPLWIKQDGIWRNGTTSEGVDLQDASGGTFTFGADFGHGWDAGYNFAAGAEAEDGYTAFRTQDYKSLAGSNLNHPMSSSPAWWEPIEDSLGADDAYWITTPGLLRPNRGQDYLGGDTYVHMNARAGGDCGAYWSQAITGPQWSEAAGGGRNPAPAVRMSTTEDTCYYAICTTSSDEGGAFYDVALWKSINGSKTQIATASQYVADLVQAFMVYAYGSTIGIARQTGAVDNAGNWPNYHVAREIILAVTDTSIPDDASHNHIGVRGFQSATEASIHEWYGGSFGFLTADEPIVTGTSAIISGFKKPGTLVTVT